MSIRIEAQALVSEQSLKDLEAQERRGNGNEKAPLLDGKKFKKYCHIEDENTVRIIVLDKQTKRKCPYCMKDDALVKETYCGRRAYCFSFLFCIFLLPLAFLPCCCDGLRDKIKRCRFCHRAFVPIKE